MIERAKQLCNKLCEDSFSSDEELVEFLFQSSKVVTFINPINFMKLIETCNFIEDIDHIFCDGIAASTILSFFLQKKLKRNSFDFTSLATPVFKYCIKNNKSIYLIGSDSDTLENFSQVILRSFPGLKIVGKRDGYLGSEPIENVVDNIKSFNPDLVLCGMGCPLQENFSAIGSKSMPSTQFITCGGFFHQHQQETKYYPEWIDRFHLRMPYRFFKEKHTRSRIFLYPKFFLYILINSRGLK